MPEKKKVLTEEELEKITGGLTVKGDMTPGIKGEENNCPICGSFLGEGMYCPKCQA